MSKKNKNKNEVQVQVGTPEVKQEAPVTAPAEVTETGTTPAEVGTEVNTHEVPAEKPAVKMTPLKAKLKEIQDKAKEEAKKIKEEIAKAKETAKAEKEAKKAEKEAKKGAGITTTSSYGRFDSFADALKSGVPLSMENLAKEANANYIEKSGKGEKGDNLKESKYVTNIGVKLLTSLKLLKVSEAGITLVELPAAEEAKTEVPAPEVSAE